MKNNAKKNKIWNGQVLAELICYLLFGGTILYLILSNRYLSYVTPKMKPYLYFTAAVMLIWTGVSLTGLFRLQRRKRTAHCLVLIIPVLLLLMPHSGMSASSLSGTAGLLTGNVVSGVSDVLGSGSGAGGSIFASRSSPPPGGDPSGDAYGTSGGDPSDSYGTSGGDPSGDPYGTSGGDSSDAYGTSGGDPSNPYGTSGGDSSDAYGTSGVDPSNSYGTSGGDISDSNGLPGKGASNSNGASGKGASNSKGASGKGASNSNGASGKGASNSKGASGKGASKSNGTAGKGTSNSNGTPGGVQDHSTAAVPNTSGAGGGSQTSSDSNTSNAPDTSDDPAQKPASSDKYMTTDPYTQSRELHGYDAKNKTITVSNDEYYYWMNEFFNNFDKLKGFKITLTGAVYKNDPTLTKDEFVPVRLAMTCCVADLTPMGLVCTYDKVSQLKSDQWVTVTGTLYQGTYQGQNEPRLKVSAIKAARPVPGYLYPYA